MWEHVAISWVLPRKGVCGCMHPCGLMRAMHVVAARCSVLDAAIRGCMHLTLLIEAYTRPHPPFHPCCAGCSQPSLSKHIAWPAPYLPLKPNNPRQQPTPTTSAKTAHPHCLCSALLSPPCSSGRCWSTLQPTCWLCTSRLTHPCTAHQVGTNNFTAPAVPDNV